MIIVKIYVPHKDNFKVFPETLESAFKILKKTDADIEKRFSVAGHEFITFKDSNDLITITD